MSFNHLLKIEEKIPPRIPERMIGETPSDILLGYQKKSLALLDTTSVLVIEKSRRIGLTWALAAHAALVAASQKSAGGMDVWYMGYDKDMAREFIDVVGMWAKAFSIAAEDADVEIFENDKGDPIQAFRIKFASGFKVVALPAVPRALRAKQGLVIVDEAAFNSCLMETLKAALAFLVWGGKVVVVSTHDGVDNPFNILIDAIKAGRRKGVTYRITFDDALADGLYERTCLVSDTVPTPEGKIAFVAEIRDFYGDDAEEELDCVPRSGAGAWIKPEDIAACEHPDAGNPGLYQGGLVYIGRDVARRGDRAVIWPFEEVGGVLWLRQRYERRNITFAEQDAAFDEMFSDYRVSSAWIDQTGMGEMVVENAQTRHGTSRVKGVLFTPPNRLDIATSLRARFEAGTIRIPPDPDIRADLRGIKRAGGSGSGLVEQGTIHPDMFWAAALACRAADTPYQAYDYQPAHSQSLFDETGFDDDGLASAMFGTGAY